MDTGEPDHDSSGEGRCNSRLPIDAERTTRRRVLATVGGLGSAASVVLAGCLEDGSAPSYDSGEVDDAEGEERTPAEMTAASALAETEADRNVTSVDGLSIADHEFVLEDGYLGSTVQGTVENTGERVELVEVRVRAYDDVGDQLGRYVDRTGDLEGDSTWAFTVIVLESPAEIADYDVAVLGMPA